MYSQNSTVSNCYCVTLAESLREWKLPKVLNHMVRRRYHHWLGGVRLTEVLIMELAPGCVDETANELAAALRPAGYYAHIIDRDDIVVIWPGRWDRVNREDSEGMEALRKVGVDLGVPLSQMAFEKLFVEDHPNSQIEDPEPGTSVLDCLRGALGGEPSLDSDDDLVCGRVLNLVSGDDGIQVRLLTDQGAVNVILPNSPPPGLYDIIGARCIDKSGCSGPLRARVWGVLTHSCVASMNGGRTREQVLIHDQALRKNLEIRRRVTQGIRSFLDGKGYMEVETPVLLPVRDIAPIAHFELRSAATGNPGALRICPENHLKRMVVAGYDRVYEIARNFRDERPDGDHLPEFTSLECYQAYGDYRDMEVLCRELILDVARKATGGSFVTVGGKKVDLAGPWERLDFCEAVWRMAGLDLGVLVDIPSLARAMMDLGLPARPDHSRRALLCMLSSEIVEPRLPSLCILADHPAETICVAKRHQNRPDLIERFELFVGGLEIAHAFSELTDAVEQRRRMDSLMCEKTRAGDVPHLLDEDFLRALDLGLPPTGGLGIGLDRLIMLFTGETIDRVVAFPG